MPNITVISAGSASFGGNTLAAIMRSQKLRGSTLSLVDSNHESPDIVHQLANRLNQEWNAKFTIEAHSHHLSANLPNTGQIANLPRGTRVESPVMVNGDGIHPAQVDKLPDAVVEGPRETALQCLLLDPMISDISTEKSVLDDHLTSYKKHLPQFWRQVCPNPYFANGYPHHC